MKTLPIEDYAVIGDTETCALVGRNGSVDWMCLPRFDSPACFAALLGDEENGRWLLAPVGPARTTRRYVGDSAVLETTHETDDGAVKVLDLMPMADRRADMIRRVIGVRGAVRMHHEWRVRFGYGKIRPWVTRRTAHGMEVIVAGAGPDKLVLRGGRLPIAQEGRHEDDFVVRSGETLDFSATWVPAHRPIPQLLDIEERIAETLARSEHWARRITYRGPHREMVVRSLITLREMTHAPTGGIVAAATTSLPEDFGGERNWDYRYCWLRDASLTLGALIESGLHDELPLWRGWLLRAIAGDPEDMQIMYAVDGARELTERTLDHLAGYASSTPVRVGNGAVEQTQSDVLGEVMNALHAARDAGIEESRQSWSLQRMLVEELAGHWKDPDNGLWEIRGPRRRFTHSRVMMWVAFDRAVRAVEDHGMKGPVDRWRSIRDEIRDEVLELGFNEHRNTFTQHYDTTDVDASLLLLPMVGFIDGTDPRMVGTIEAVEHDLMRNGFLLRYRTESGVDGLSGDEHPFLACSFWLVSAYALAGRLDDAHTLMRRLLEVPNDVGLLSEEYDPTGKRFVGNFPQAFSHLALVGAANTLERCANQPTADTQRGEGQPRR